MQPVRCLLRSRRLDQLVVARVEWVVVLARTLEVEAPCSVQMAGSGCRVRLGLLAGQKLRELVPVGVSVLVRVSALLALGSTMAE